MPKPLTLPEKMDRFPPVAMRLLARVVTPEGVRDIPTKEVARTAGLSVGEVQTLSRLTSWDAHGIPIETMLAFTRGCGADLDSRDWLRKNTAYMKQINSLPRYLLRSPEWHTTYEPLIRIWLRQAA